MNIQKVKEARNKGAVAFSRYCQEKRNIKTICFAFLKVKMQNIIFHE